MFITEKIPITNVGKNVGETDLSPLLMVMYRSSVSMEISINVQNYKMA